jgi:peptidoglycan/xylan/chitin deacetylase (PgdA/CDA1 family)
MEIKYGSAKGKSEIVLTFDDGQHPELTPKLLDLLKQENIKAIFFVLGENVASGNNIEIVKRAFDEGHIIGNHTYSHKNLRNLSEEKVKEEILKTEALIKEFLTILKLLRPPYGSTNLNVNKIIQDLGYVSVLWNVDTLDWKNRSIKWVQNSIPQIDVREDSIVLMHDIHKSTVNNVAELIKTLRNKKRQFEFISYV